MSEACDKHAQFEYGDDIIFVPTGLIESWLSETDVVNTGADPGLFNRGFKISEGV